MPWRLEWRPQQFHHIFHLHHLLILHNEFHIQWWILVSGINTSTSLQSTVHLMNSCIRPSSGWSREQWTCSSVWPSWWSRRSLRILDQSKPFMRLRHLMFFLQSLFCNEIMTWILHFFNVILIPVLLSSFQLLPTFTHPCWFIFNHVPKKINTF